MALAVLNDQPLPFDPDQVQFGFDMKTHTDDTIGGRVVQVIGVRINDMVVAGSFRDLHQQESFYDLVRSWVDHQVATKGSQPLRFVYPPKNWDLTVLIESLRDGTQGASVTYDDTIVAPRYLLTLFVVADNAGTVEAGLTDAYISRLTEGVGWRQSAYNGPEQNTATAGALELLWTDIAQTGRLPGSATGGGATGPSTPSGSTGRSGQKRPQ